MTTDTPYRAIIAGVAAMPPIVLREVEYTGPYLSTLLSINPEQPAAESARTSQLIVEFGRLVAAALREKEMTEVRYRVWRDTQVLKITTDGDFAKEQGFAKVASATTAENWVHTLPEYLTHQGAMAAATEVWSVLHAAYTAAQARTRAVMAWQGGADQSRRGSAPAPLQAEGGGTVNVYTGGSAPEEPGEVEEDIVHNEALVSAGPRTPVPPIVGPPPPPPPGAKVPPPPPPPR